MNMSASKLPHITRSRLGWRIEFANGSQVEAIRTFRDACRIAKWFYKREDDYVRPPARKWPIWQRRLMVGIVCGLVSAVLTVFVLW